MLLNFESAETKQRSLLPDLRLFGFRVGSIQCGIEDADVKTSILVQNIVWGTELGHVVDFLNNVIRGEDKTSCVTFRIDPNDRRKIITKNFIVLGLSSFEESLRVLKILNLKQFKGRELSVNHCFGNVRYSEAQSDVFEGLNKKTVLLKKVQQNQQKLFESQEWFDEETNQEALILDDALKEFDHESLVSPEDEGLLQSAHSKIRFSRTDMSEIDQIDQNRDPVI